jgi:serine protease AprX
MARCRKLLVLPVLLLTAAFAFTGTLVLAQPARAQTAVFEYRDAHPGEAVPVIIQSDGAHDPFELVRSQNGVVRSVLGVIHAVAADIPSDRIEALTSQPGVTWVSLDSAIAATDNGGDGGRKDGSNDKGPNNGDNHGNKPVSDSGPVPSNVYPQEVRADQAWKLGDFGQGVGVAVVDTGIASSPDFTTHGQDRVVARVSRVGTSGDGFGHGTHVAGLIGGDGGLSSLRNIGVAPLVNLVDVKVGGDDGSATVSDVISGLQFVLDNQAQYNIRVVNLSLSSDTAQSYTTDPLDAAVELLTFRGILVVVAAGNTGSVPDAVSYAPANDPFVLSVGAVDDKTTPDPKDDSIPVWSSRGVTQDNVQKPDVYVPGRRLVSVLSPGSVLATEFPQNIVDTNYFMLSGTSMAAGVASGTAALVFEAHPDWTPGQVKLALAQTARPLSDGGPAGLAQVDKAIKAAAPVDSSLNIKPNYLLLNAAGVTDPENISWGSISWGSISWGSISWSRISWGSVSFDRISWGDVSD